MSKIQWKLARGKTWRRKLEEEHPNHGKVMAVPPRMQKRFGTGTMLIPRPLDIDVIVRQVRKGSLIRQGQIREMLARQAGADCTCPLTTGIFLRIIAEAAEEDRASGKKRITPYWRVIKDDGGLNEKFPGGADAQAAYLDDEGIRVRWSKSRKRAKVEDYAGRPVNALRDKRNRSRASGSAG